MQLAPNLSDEAESRAVDAVEPILRGIDAPKVLVGGELLVDREFSERAEKDAQRAELISLPIALIVMAIVFGGVVAAGLPLAIAFAGVFATMVALGIVASVTDVSLYALNVVIMLGIGLGIDYGLLMISRFREERGAGFDTHRRGTPHHGDQRSHGVVLRGDRRGRACRASSCSRARRCAPSASPESQSCSRAWPPRSR